MLPTPNQSDMDIDKVPLTTLEQWGGQWRTLYEHKRRLHDVNSQQIILGQFFTLIFTIVVSTLLDLEKEALLTIGTSLVIYPALADMLSSNAAVLSTSVHHDLEEQPDYKWWRIVLSLGQTTTVAILSSIILGLISGAVGTMFFETPFVQTLLLASLSGGLTGLLGMPVMLLATFLVRRLQTNPDNVTAPLETAIFSSLTLASIIFVSRYIL